MTTFFAAEFLAIAVALWLIAWGVLRLNHPAPAPAMPAPRSEVIYINIERPGHGIALRDAINSGFKYAAKDGKWITLRRDGK